jgi:hypothetical protein
MGFTGLGAAASIAFFAGYGLDSQAAVVPSAPAQALTYADSADLALAAPIVAHVRVARASALRPRDSAGVAAGYRRFLIEAQIVSLIRSPDTLPARIRYLVDLPDDSRGRAARLPKRSEHLVLAEAVAGRPNELRLIAPDSMIPYDSSTAARLRAILTEAAAQGAAPRIAGIGRAFHVPGAIPGESETQFFLQTAEGRPVSISVLRRPGETARWAVSLAEIVDEAAEAPRPDTLLWYRLACTLPRSVPAHALADAEPRDRAAITADYDLIVRELGPCTRNRVRR